MKNIFFLTAVLLTQINSFAQNTNTLFLTYALSNPEPVYNRGVVGGAGYRAVASSSFGLRYYIKSAKIITLETGIDYSSYHFKLDYVDNPNTVIPDVQQTARLISIPVYAHLTFLRYLFLNGGVIVDTEINKPQNHIDKQSGIGLGLGFGLKYRYKKMNIFINPFFERHALLGFDNSRGPRQSIINPGGRVGLGYSF